MPCAPLRPEDVQHKYGASFLFWLVKFMDAVLNSLMLVAFYALDFYKWIVIVNVVLSWLVAFNVINTTNQFVHMVMDFTYRMTEPVYGRIRSVLPNMGGIDLSPLVVLFAIMFLQSLISQAARGMF